MRKRINYFGFPLILILILTSFRYSPSHYLEVPKALKADLSEAVMFPEVEASEADLAPTPPFLGKSFVGFKEALAFMESQGDYVRVNQLGYLGKYQFGVQTLQLMGVYDVESFLHDPELQEQVFRVNLARNKWILRRDIEWFAGHKVGGIMVTESGMLAAAHLAGAGNVKKYLRSNGVENFEDDFGTDVGYYLKKFGGYDVSNITPKKNPKI